MDRRTAIATAAAAALTVTAGAAAIAANLDMLGAQEGQLGKLEPVAPLTVSGDPPVGSGPVEVETIVVDVPAAGQPAGAPGTDDLQEEEIGYEDDDGWYERDEDDRDDDSTDDWDDDSDDDHEYEGQDDDD